MSIKNKQVIEHDAAYIHAFHEGIRLNLNGQDAEAISKFNTCLLKDAEDDAVHFALAQIYLNENKLDQAAIHSLRAAEIDPKNEHYQSELAFMYMELQKYTEAIVVFERILKKTLNNPSYYQGAVECYLKVGNVKKGINLLNRMENNLGSNPSIALEKFKLYVAAKQDEEAINTLKEAQKKFENEPLIVANLVDYYLQHKRFQEGFDLLKELVFLDPNNGMALLMLGDMQIQSGDAINGLINLKAAIKSEGPSLDQKMNILIALQGQEVIDPDMESLVQYMRLKYPKEAKAHSITGDYYFKVNQIVQAVAAYKAALHCDPNIYPIWNQILLLEYQYQQFDSLAVDAEKCIGFFPTQPLPYFVLGVSLNEQNTYQKAFNTLALGMEFVMQDPDLMAEFHGQMGKAMFGMNNTIEGIAEFEKALHFSAQNTFVKSNYADFLALYKLDLVKAEKLIDEVLKNNPNEATYLETKGLILFQQGKYVEAKLFFEQVCGGSESKDARCIEYLGDLAFMLGKKDDALAYWLRAKELGSKNRSIDEKIIQKKYVQPIF